LKPLASGFFWLTLRRCLTAVLLFAAVAPHEAEAASGPAGSLTASTTTAFVGQNITFTAIANGTPGNQPPTVLDFGNGTSVALVQPYPQFVTHFYGVPGVYVAKLELAASLTVIGQVTITVANPATFTLTGNPSSIIAGQVVTFTATTGAKPVPGAYVDFGDGTNAAAPSNFNQIQHRYGAPGLYTARLAAVGSIGTLATSPVSVTQNPVQVPVGQVYSTFLVASPVLAGADTAISISFRIFTPFALGPTGVSPLQAIVELATEKGKVVQRSDPFALPFTQQNVNSAQTVMIPYTVPADAGGNYLVTVYVRSATGGTIAIGRPQPVQIIGGPDPKPVITNAFHANGAIITGSGANRGAYGVNLGLTTAAQWATDELLLTGLFDPVSKKVDPLLTFMSATPAPITSPNATPAPNSTSTEVDSGQVPPPPTSVSPAPEQSGAPPSPSPEGSEMPTPPSHGSAPPNPTPTPKAERVHDVLSATPTPQPAPQGSSSTPSAMPSPQLTPPPALPPAAAPPPAPAPTPTSTPLQFKDVVGRTDAALPAIIGSKETLRGADATYVLGSGWTFHGGGGYFQLPSNTTTERTGGLLDIAKTWMQGQDTFRISLSDNSDSVNKFVQTGTTGPLRVGAGVFEYTDQVTPHLRWLITGGQSNTYQLTGGLPTLYDTADQTDLLYSVGTTSVDVNYHNAGPQFGTLSGASALSDRAGGAGTLSFTTSPISQVQVGYARDDVRSVFSSSTRTNAVFNMTPPHFPGIALTVERDTALSPGSDATTNTGNLVLNHSGLSSFTVSGNLTAVHDSLNPEAYSTQRTGVFTYQYANGPHTLGFGVNGTNTTSVNPSALVTTSVNYGFTFGGRSPPNTTGQPWTPGIRYFEMKFALSNANSQAPTAGSHADIATGLLSWHMTPQLAPGLEANYSKTYTVFPLPSTTQNSFLRFRLDVNM